MARPILLGAAAVLTVATVAACGPVRQEPVAVQASNPKVTYQYTNDDQLLDANQKATVYCSQYQALPRTLNISPTPAGANEVVFECLPRASVAALPAVAPLSPQVAAVPAPVPVPVTPNVSYSYRSDRELLDAARSAQIYCANNGYPRVTTASTSTNTAGTRTVTFQCSQV
jgi:hypothetical protein